MSQTRRRYTIFVDFEKQDVINFQTDGSITIQGNEPRQLRTTIPTFMTGTISPSSDIQVSFYRPPTEQSPYHFQLASFKRLREAGLHIEWGLDTPTSSLHSLFAELGLNISLNSIQSEAVKTDNYYSLYYDFSSPEQFILPNKLLSLEDNLLEAETISVTYGRKPRSATAQQKETDLIIEASWSIWDSSTMAIQASSNEDKAEVGLFKIADVSDPTHIILSGISKVVGSNGEKFDKTVINYSPIFRSHSQLRYSVSFVEPLGLHPKQTLSLSGSLMSPERNCKCYAKYTIPRDLFLDKYQLRSQSFLNRKTLSLIEVWGETDLENPIWLTDGWGSEALFEVHLPKYDHLESEFEVELPMHLRYKEPSNDSNMPYSHGSVPWPVVFWACKDSEQSPSPDIAHVNYESLFPQDTLFYYAEPEEGASLSLCVTTPVAPNYAFTTIQWLTVIVILGGVLYLVDRIVHARNRLTKETKDKKNK